MVARCAFFAVDVLPFAQRLWYSWLLSIFARLPHRRRVAFLFWYLRGVQCDLSQKLDGQDVWNWLKGNSDPVIAIGTFLQLVALVVGVITLVLTKRQIEDAHDALRASTEFQIQRDGRELLSALPPTTFQYIYRNQPLSGENQLEANIKIVEILNYYAAISRQGSAGVLDPEFWGATRREFCFFIGHPNVKAIWDAGVKATAYPQQLVEAGRSCRTEASGTTTP